MSVWSDYKKKRDEESASNPTETTAHPSAWQSYKASRDAGDSLYNTWLQSEQRRQNAVLAVNDYKARQDLDAQYAQLGQDYRSYTDRNKQGPTTQGQASSRVVDTKNMAAKAEELRKQYLRYYGSQDERASNLYKFGEALRDENRLARMQLSQAGKYGSYEDYVAEQKKAKETATQAEVVSKTFFPVSDQQAEQAREAISTIRKAQQDPEADNGINASLSAGQLRQAERDEKLKLVGTESVADRIRDLEADALENNGINQSVSQAATQELQMLKAMREEAEAGAREDWLAAEKAAEDAKNTSAAHATRLREIAYEKRAIWQYLYGYMYGGDPKEMWQEFKDAEALAANDAVYTDEQAEQWFGPGAKGNADTFLETHQALVDDAQMKQYRYEALVNYEGARRVTNAENLLNQANNAMADAINEAQQRAMEAGIDPSEWTGSREYREIIKEAEKKQKAARELYESEYKATYGANRHGGKAFWDRVRAGAMDFASKFFTGTQMLAFAIPDEWGVKQAINANANDYQAAADRYREIVNYSTRAMGDNPWWERGLGLVEESTRQALDFMMAAILSGGSGASAGHGEAAKMSFSQIKQASGIKDGATKLVNALVEGAKFYYTNPEYWSVFLMEAGNGYRENLKRGMSEGRAAALSLLNASVNAKLEFGLPGMDSGGLQSLYHKSGGHWDSIAQACLDLLDTGLGEAKEELEQGVAEGIILKAGWNNGEDRGSANGMKWFSTTSGEDAVINAKDLGESALAGFLMGAGGGAVRMPLEIARYSGSSYNEDIDKIVSKYVQTYGEEGIQEIIREGIRNAPEGSEYHEAAVEIQKKGSEATDLEKARLISVADQWAREADQNEQEYQQASYEADLRSQAETIAKTILPDQSDAVLSAWELNPTDNLEGFATEFHRLYNRGLTAQNQEEALASVKTLTQEQAIRAYGMGLSDHNTQTEELLEKQRTAAPGSGKIYFTETGDSIIKDGKGKLIEGKGIADFMKNLNKNQRDGVALAQRLAQGSGSLDFVFYKSTPDEDGVYRQNQGGFNRDRPNTIYVDLNSGVNSTEEEGDLSRYILVKTLDHEYNHSGEFWAPKEYDEHRAFILSTMRNRGIDTDALINARIEREFSKRKDLTASQKYDRASREVVSDAMQDIFRDSKLMQQAADQDPSMVKKIVRKLRQLLNKIRNYFKNVTPTTDPGALALQEVGADGELHYLEEVVDSFERYQRAAEENRRKAAQRRSFGAQEQSAETTVQNQSRNSKGTKKDQANESPSLSRRSDNTGAFSMASNNVSVAGALNALGIDGNIPELSDSVNSAIVNLYSMVQSVENGKALPGDKRVVNGSSLLGSLVRYGIVERSDVSGSSAYRTDNGHTLRVSDHQTHARFYNTSDENLSVYIRTSMRTSGRFAGDDSTPIIEAEFSKKYLDNHPDVLANVIRDIAGFIVTGEYHDTAGARNYHFSGDATFVSEAKERMYNDAIERGDEAAAERIQEQRMAPESIGVNIDTQTESASPAEFSERTWNESEYVLQRNKAAKELAEALGISQKKATDYIDSINSIAKMIADDRMRLDYESSPGRSSFVSNVEYGGSFDFSTLCKKRRLMTGTFSAIQEALPNTALTADEILEIRNMMKEKGLEVSCGLCYVEGSRANMGQFTQQFLELYKKHNPGAWVPNMAQMNTPDGIEQVRIQHPEVYDAYEYFWNHYGTLEDGDPKLFASQQKPKLYQLRTEYKNEILTHFKGDSTVEAKNKNGGVRIQSFSDFEIVHLIDMMQIIMDMSKVGLAGQAYTKVPDFALALGNTGLKINLSLIAKGVDANGQLIFDDVEGMEHETAFRIRDMYSKDVGTIIVVFTDEQLKAAMADPRIDFIIPFHRSQWKRSQYSAMGLPANTKDYTYMQNERYIRPQYHEYHGRMVKDKASNYMPNEYWDFSLSGKENAERYLRMCAENNKRPKFYKLLVNNGDGSYSLQPDGSTDGYWKLLIDFKMYDNDGVGSPQTAVRPDFNMQEATRMLKGYEGGHQHFPVARGVVDEFVAQYKENHQNMQYSSRYSDSNVPVIELSEENELSQFIKDHPDINVRTAIREYLKMVIPAEGIRMSDGRVVFSDSADRRELTQDIHPRRQAEIGKLREIIQKAQAFSEADVNHKRFSSFVYYGAIVVMRSEKYPIILNIGKAKSDDRYHLYAITKDNKGRIADGLNRLSRPEGLITSNPSDGIVSSPDQVVNHDATENQLRTPTLSNRDLLRIAAEELASMADDAGFTENQIAAVQSVVDDIEALDKAEGMEREALSRMRHTVSGYNLQISNLTKERDAAQPNSEEWYSADARLQEMTTRKETAMAPLRQAWEERHAEVKRLEAVVSHKENAHSMQNILKKARDLGIRRARRNEYESIRAYAQQHDERQTANRHRAVIKAEAKQLREWLNHPDRKNIRKHVPVPLQSALANFLMSIDESSERSLKGGEPMRADMRMVQNMMQLQQILAGTDPETQDPMYYDLPVGFADQLSKQIAQIQSIMAANTAEGGYVLNRMTSEQLKDLRQTIQTLRRFVQNFNSFYNASLYQHVYEAAEDTMQTLGQMNRKEQSKLDSLSNFVNWQNLRPAYAFERFGDGGRAVWNSIKRGQSKLAFLAKEIIDFSEETFTAEEANAWNNEVKNIQLPSGGTVQMTVSQIMSLYELNKREQARIHLYGGGFRPTNIERRGRRTITNDNHRVDVGDVNYIISQLTDRQKQVADALQNFMATRGGELGNEISMKRFLLKQFTDETYFPINSDGRNIAITESSEKMSSSTLFSLINSSFTQDLNPNADNALAVYPIFEVFSNHMADMAQYNAFALPLLDALKWLNYQERDENGVATGRSVRQAMMDAYGFKEGGSGYAVDFVKGILKALNGTETQGSKYDTFLTQALHHFNATRVAFNGRVVVQQPLAFARAALVMDPRDMVTGIKPARIKSNIEEMRKYSGLALWKSLGFFDVNISNSLSGMIAQDSDWRQRMTEIGLAGAELGDTITWATMWEAAKNQATRENYHGEARLTRAAEIFENVIYKTQVVDSVLTKSEYMRQKNFVNRLLSSFMAEPTTTASMISDAIFQYNTDVRNYGRGGAWSRNWRNIARTTAVFTITALLNAAITAVYDAWRDDDDYETFWEKVMEHFKNNFGEELNPFRLLPLISDIAEYTEYIVRKDFFGDKEAYYNPTSLMPQSLTTLESAFAKVKRLVEGEKNISNIYAAVSKLLDAVSGLAGIPAYPILRELKDFWNNTAGKVNNKWKVRSYDAGVKSRVKDAFMSGYLTEEEARAEIAKAEPDKPEAPDIVGEWASVRDLGIKYDDLDDAYIDDEISFDELVDAYINYGYMSESEAMEKASLIDWKKQNGSTMSAAGLKAFNNYCSDAGVSEVNFTTIWKLKSGGGKKDEVVQAINQLDINKGQKDALYRCVGYSEKEIGKTPWHN